MNLTVGIVGLPNVGKSTLFNALLKKQAALAANYPFATIEPNVGVVPVPDQRLVRLAEITKAEHSMVNLPPIKPATVEFVDIAGLVRGASEGEGLGNKFLSHIREVQIISHVVRAFEDEDVPRYDEARPLTPERSDGERGSVDVLSDYKTIRTELALADLQSIQNSKGKTSSFAKASKDKQKIIENIETSLNEEKIFDLSNLTKEEQGFVKSLNLLSLKKEIIVLNVSENEYNDENTPAIIEKYAQVLSLEKENFIVICAKVESELSELNEGEQKEYLESLGVKKSGLEMLIKKAYEALGLISFLTCGEIEVRAWTIKKGSSAVAASGEIHTDFMDKFIKAEVVGYDDFISSNGPARNDSASSSSVSGGWKGARSNGKARLEGRDYVMRDGDVVEFKIGR